MSQGRARRKRFVLKCRAHCEVIIATVEKVADDGCDESQIVDKGNGYGIARSAGASCAALDAADFDVRYVQADCCLLRRLLN